MKGFTGQIQDLAGTPNAKVCSQNEMRSNSDIRARRKDNSATACDGTRGKNNPRTIQQQNSRNLAVQWQNRHQRIRRCHTEVQSNYAVTEEMQKSRNSSVPKKLL